MEDTRCRADDRCQRACPASRRHGAQVEAIGQVDATIAAANGTSFNVVAMNMFLSARRQQTRTNKLMPLRVHDTDTAEGEQKQGSELPQAMAGESTQPTEEPVIRMLRDAIEQAFARCTAEEFVLLQLSYSDGIRQQELARIWDCDAATISRKLKRASGDVATRVLEHVHASDPYLELGTGIENIFKFLRVDFIWRVTPDATPGEPANKRFGVFGSFKLQF